MDKILNFTKRLIPKKIFKFFQPAYHFCLSWFSSLVYGWPSEKLIVIGVTGTTGKTTSAYLMAKMLESAGFRVGYTSTAMFSDGDKEWLNDKKMTMVGRFFTQKILKQMVKNNCQYAIIETTSEGIRQWRHRFINYDILVFTGLYPEHIDSHGSFENYKKAKGKLFAHLKDCRTKYADDNKQVLKSDKGFKKIELNRVKKTIIANLDDKQADYFLGFWGELKFGYTKTPASPNASQGGRKHENTPTQGWSASGGKTRKHIKGAEIVYYSDVKASEKGTSFKFSNKKIDLRLLGEFNATNSMNAVCVGLAQGLGLEKIKSGLEKIKGAPGRFEKINQGQNFTVIVDYAFEPKAVTKLYETVKLIPHKKIIHVLGSTGGGRDAARRPKLGQLAGKKADFTIITNEDPYDDDPNLIIRQVAEGAVGAGKKVNQDLFKILDRREAIKKALSLAKEGDLVLITGKGSEQAICAASGKKIPWDDRVVAREELQKL